MVTNAYLTKARNWQSAHILLGMVLAAAVAIRRETCLQEDARIEGAKAILFHGVIRDTSIGIAAALAHDECSEQISRHVARISSPSSDAFEWVHHMNPFERLLLLYVRIYTPDVNSPMDKLFITWLADLAEEAYGRGLTIVHEARKAVKRPTGMLTKTVPQEAPRHTDHVIGRLDTDGTLQMG